MHFAKASIHVFASATSDELHDLLQWAERNTVYAQVKTAGGRYPYSLPATTEVPPASKVAEYAVELSWDDRDLKDLQETLRVLYETLR